MLKKLLTPLLFITSLNSYSQITKGNWIIGGSASFSSTKYKSEIFGPSHKGSNILLKPNLGFFVIDKLATGVIGEYRRIGGENSYWYGFNIGPLLKTDNIVNIITEGFYSFGIETGNSASTANKNTLGLSLGPVIFLNNIIGIETLVNYSSEKYNGYKGRNNSVTTSIGFQIHLEKE